MLTKIEASLLPELYKLLKTEDPNAHVQIEMSEEDDESIGKRTTKFSVVVTTNY